ncbi:hypothetical protein BVIET440_70235 [Burkholderia vietnamiensis]|uniref:Uncharacterized protein n=1 Tax=Burkholderia vietnamiensis (strain G4 / LMG 22486) TaxID=269482 RepID=A4JJ57_BURVG|nr:hypothetical protein Bcep1808_3321 [Burkholderia vietnamiensis G4]
MLVGNPTPQSANCFSRNNTGADSDCRYGYNRCLDWQESNCGRPRCHSGNLLCRLLHIHIIAVIDLRNAQFFLLALLIHECLYYSNGPDVINGLQIKNL